MPLLRRLVLPPSFTCDTPKPVFSAEFMCPSQPPTPHVHCACTLGVRDAGGTAKCVPQVSATRTPAVSDGDEARRGRWHRQLSEVARTAHTTRFPGAGAMVDWMHFGCSESKEINADFLEALRRHMPHIRHDAPPPPPLLLQEAWPPLTGVRACVRARRGPPVAERADRSPLCTAAAHAGQGRANGPAAFAQRLFTAPPVQPLLPFDVLEPRVAAIAGCAALRCTAGSTSSSCGRRSETGCSPSLRGRCRLSSSCSGSTMTTLAARPKAPRPPTGWRARASRCKQGTPCGHWAWGRRTECAGSRNALVCGTLLAGRVGGGAAERFS